MVVWQFTTIAALMGAVLIYVMVLTNRLANTNALLKRIEEALARPQPVRENDPVAALERQAAQEASSPAHAEEAPAADVPDRDRRVSFLTVRDLKVIARSGRRSSDSAVGVSPLFAEVFGNKLEGVQSQPAEAAQPAVSEEAVVTGIEAQEPEASSTAAVVEELAVATNEIREFLDTPPESPAAIATEKPAAPDVESDLPADVKAPSVDAELEEKRRRDQQHFLLARRRHRMR